MSTCKPIAWVSPKYVSVLRPPGISSDSIQIGFLMLLGHFKSRYLAETESQMSLLFCCSLPPDEMSTSAAENDRPLPWALHQHLA